MKLTDMKGLAIAGGGVLGTAHIGTLSVLYEHGFNPHTFAGTSIGSIIASCLACKCDIKLLENIIKDFDYNKILSGKNFIYKAYDLFYKRGCHTVKNLKNLYFEFINKITGDGNITFIDVFNKYGSYLIVTATCRKSHKLVIFNKDTSPDMSIVEACVYSSSVPFLFESYRYVDGGVIDNYPIEYVVERVGLDRTIGLNFKKNLNDVNINDLDQMNDGLFDFTIDILDTLLTKIVEDELTQGELFQTIAIDTHGINSFDFNINDEQKQKLFESGKISAINYIKSHNL